jgi:hypothetical protein
MHYYSVWGCCFMSNSGTLLFMEYMDGFTEMGAISLNIVDSDRVIVGVLADTPDRVALALGNDANGNYYLLQLTPERARQLAASLLNKSDSVEGIK